MKLDRVLGGIFGVCVGDALGLPVQFQTREERKAKPVTDMTGYGAFGVPPGTWSDDSSLTLCLAESLCGGYDLGDIAGKFRRWLYEGYWTPFNKAFDVGGTTFRAIERLERGVDPRRSGDTAEDCNGNGSLMRILPLVFAVRGLDAPTRFRRVHGVSAITHAHPRTLVACGIYVQTALGLLEGLGAAEAVERMKGVVTEQYGEGAAGGGPAKEAAAARGALKDASAGELPHFGRILGRGAKEFASLPEGEIRSGGYVVDTLEAALWCLLNGRSYEDTVLKAVNLGWDTDTTAAVAGGLGGILHGLGKIPERWVEAIAMRQKIEELARRLHGSLAHGPPDERGA